MSEKRYGELPHSPVVFAACDSNYFKKFAPAFLASIAKNTKLNAHVHVINPDDEVLALACYLNSMVSNEVTYTFSDSDLSQYNQEQKRALYASLRFLVAPLILQHAGEMLILDIDCMVMENFNYPKDYKVGYFPRKPLEGTVGWEQEGTKVAAGCVYFHKDAMNVCNAVGETLGGLELRWFNDQIALNHVFSQLPEEVCWKYDWTFMDWEFKEGTIIWTGKGPRKYDNPKYVNKQNEYTDMIMNYDYDQMIPDRIILKPRLDTPFKRFGLTIANSVREPIRKHWANFVDKMTTERTHIVESPRWMFNENIEKYFPNTQILVPHVEQHVWGGGHKTYYYMQTVFPWLFTLDPLGWAGGAQYISSFDPKADYDDVAYRNMQEYIQQGSKFQHLQSKTTQWGTIDKGYYIIVPLQLPHDETIKYHSDFSVEEFVTRICEWVVENDDAPEVVFKGHPVNLESMKPLKEIVEKFRADGEQRVKDSLTYIEQGNFHELVNESIGMFVLNGGSGQEAMLLEKPVVCFGRCDYAPAVIQGDIKDVDQAYNDMMFDDENIRIEMYKRWFDWYIKDICIDTRK